MPKAGEAVSKTPQTQVGRADAARHPPHRGLFARGARPFRARLPPLQDRLPKELALAGVTTVAAANRWLAESDCPAHNVAFAVTPAEAGSAFSTIAPAGCARSCASRRTAGWATTIPSSGGASPCRSRRAHCGPIVRAAVRVHEHPTDAWRSSTGRIGWSITTPWETRAMTPNWLREPLRQPACGFADNVARCPQPHRPNHYGSGQLTRYENRSTRRVSNSRRTSWWCWAAALK